MRNVRFESKTTPSHWKSLRVLGVLFCLIVLTVGFAGAAGASGIDITLGTPASGDNWAYDSLNETLTLNGGTWEYINATGTGDLILVLNGTNNITGGFVVKNIVEGVAYQEFYSICVMYGNLTIQNGADGGTLNVTANVPSLESDAYGIYASGIYAEGNITFKCGTVDLNISGDSGCIEGVFAAGAVSISDGLLNIGVVASGDDTQATGIYAYDDEIEISSGQVNIEVAVSGYDAEATGICADDINILGGTVNIKAEASGNDAEATGIYSYYDEIEISSGQVDIEAEASGYDAMANGIYAYDIKILGGTVNIEATASGYDAMANGIYAYEIKISSGTVNIEAEASGDSAEAKGICAYEIKISGGTVIAESHSVDGYAFGIYTRDNLFISDSAKVNVSDVTADSESESASHVSAYGIYVESDSGNLVISDSAKVNVTEVIGCCSYGIHVRGNLTISDTAEVMVSAVTSTDVTSTDDSAYGIHTVSGNLVISDSAEVMVSAVTSTDDSAYGILTSSGNLTISDSAEVTVTEVTGLSASGIGTGWDIEISGGTVTVDVQATAADCPVQGIIPYYDAVISGGAVTVNAISLNGPAYGLTSYMDDIFISGGSVTVNTEATGNDASGIYTSSYSMDDGVEDTGDIFISGGEVTVNAKAGGESEYVISAYSIQSQRGVIEISGGVVTANAKATEKADAYGLSAESEITISDGSVTVYADAAGDYAYGIYVDSGGVFAQTNGVVNTRAKVTGDLGYAYGVGDHNSEITGGKITAIGDNWAFAASYSSDRLIVASTLTVRASENIEGTGLSEVSPSVVTEVGSEYKYVVIEYLQKDDTPSGNSGSSSKPSKPSKPVEPEIPEEPSEPGIITPSETIVEDTKEIIVSDETTEVLETGETVTVVELEDTEIIQSVAVPEEIAEENPGASVMVTEGNKDTVLLPGDITTEDVHVIVDLAVVDTEGKPVKIKSSGYFILDANVPNGKKLAVGHYKDGIWEDCKVEHIGNGQYKVHYNSLSPFAAVFIEEDEESPFVVAEEPVDEPEIPENPESSMPILAVLAGLGVVVLIRRK